MKTLAIILGLAGLALLAVFGVRLGTAPEGFAWRLVRMDVSIALALLVPTLGLLPRFRSALVADGPRWTVALLALACGAAFQLGRFPGRPFESLGTVLIVAAALAGGAACVVSIGAGRAGGLRAAWLVSTFWSLGAAWQVGARPVLGWLLAGGA